MMEAAAMSYVLPVPFEHAAKRIRRVLAESQHMILSETDLAVALRRELRIDLAPCRLFLVCRPMVLLETLTLFPTAAVILPLHLVLCKREEQSEAHILNFAFWRQSAGSQDIQNLLEKEFLRLAQALQRVAMRKQAMLAL